MSGGGGQTTMCELSLSINLRADESFRSFIEYHSLRYRWFIVTRVR
jgi:hypothetical protein